MKVILLQDIENLGKKHEVKEVKNGYARNFLIPKGLVKIATKESLEWLKNKKEMEDEQAKEELKKTQELASALDGQEVVFAVKIGEEGQLFETINVAKIEESLKKQGFDIQKIKVNLTEPIKELGEFPVKVKFDHNLEAEIMIVIEEEK
jgi:large subunit ribosomal protein L9